METTALPKPEPARVGPLFHFCRLQLPTLSLSLAEFENHLSRTYALYADKADNPGWVEYFDTLYILDWFVASACLQGLDTAWEQLFASRAGRSDCLLLDALRGRAARLYPRDEEKQDSAVTEFWGNLFTPPERPGSLPILARYDGLRPLVPWLIRVFQNWHISELRKDQGPQALPEDDIVPMPAQDTVTDRWHDVFVSAAHEWMDTLQEKELLILGLRLRYQMSQRDVAKVLEVHEGTLSRRTDALSEQWKKHISQQMIAQGWDGEDLSGYVRTEMRNLLLDDPRLSVPNLANILAAQGKSLPQATEES